MARQRTKPPTEETDAAVAVAEAEESPGSDLSDDTSTETTDTSTSDDSLDTTTDEQVDQPAADAPAFSVRDLAAQHGFDLSQIEDDQQAIQHLIQQAAAERQRSEQTARQAERYYYESQLLRQQQLAAQQQAQAQQQPAQAKASYWKAAPEYDPKWTSLLTRDEQGRLVAVPGAQPDLPQKYQAYQDWLADRVSVLAKDPVEAIAPGLQPILEQWATGIRQQIAAEFQQANQQQAAVQQAHDFLAQNSDWLYQKDQQGNLRTNTQGEYVLSPKAQLFKGFLQQAYQNGVTNQALAADYALAKAEQVSQQRGQRQAQAPVTQQERNMQFLKDVAARQPNRNGSVAQAGFNTPAQNSSQDFRQMLTAAVAAEGHSFDD